MLRKARVREAVDSPVGRFPSVVRVLIVVSLVSFSVDTLPDLPSWLRAAIFYLDSILCLVFLLEYGARVWVAENKLRFIFSFYGVIDFFALIPFYLFSGADLRPLRLFRLLRLFKLTRHAAAMRRLYLMMQDIRGELAVFMSLAGMIVFIAASGIYYFESPAQPDKFGSIFQCLWWAVVTLTTVGYGDVYPITVGGKLFTGLVLLVGLGIVAVPSGLVASGLTALRQNNDKE